MKTSTLLAALAAVLTIVPARVDAQQQLMLQIQNGLVTLDAQNVTVRQILAEWARIGGAKIVNGDKVLGGPVTLQLTSVPERQALDSILRGVSGYMLAPRLDAASGASRFDRILIMPTSSAPQRASTAPAGATPMFTSRPMPAQAGVAPVESEAVVEDDDHDDPGPGDGDAEAEEEEPPQPPPGAGPRFQRRGPNFQNPMVGAQPFTPQPFPGPPPQPVDAEDDGAPGQQPATAPFNVPPGASATPGVISPPPQDPQQPNMRPPRRPPA